MLAFKLIIINWSWLGPFIIVGGKTMTHPNSHMLMNNISCHIFMVGTF